MKQTIARVMVLISMISTNVMAQEMQNVKAEEKKVLFIMSAAKELPLKNGETYKETGVFLSELYLGYKSIIDAGYTVDIATPNGIVSSIDKESYKTKYWKGHENLLDEGKDFVIKDEKFNKPMTLETALANSKEYSGLVVPGGQGLMVDLIKDKTMAEIIKEFAKDKKIVGLICHAPALLLSIPKEENPFIGYKVNSITGIEELFIETFIMKGEPEKRRIGKQLNELGLKHKSGFPGWSSAVRDRELVTSQNPYSDEEFAVLYLEALKEYEAKKMLK